MKFSRISAAFAVAAIASMASIVKAAPVVNLSILGWDATAGQTSANASANLANVNPGDTIDYEVVGSLNYGAQNTSWGYTVGSSAQQSATDGIGGVSLINLTDAAAQLTATGALQSGFGAGTGASVGTSGGGSITSITGLLGTGITYEGVPSGVVMYSGAFSAATYSSDTIAGSFGTGAILNAKVSNSVGTDKNIASKAIAATDPYVAIASLNLTEATESSVPAPNMAMGFLALAPAAFVIGWVRRRRIA